MHIEGGQLTTLNTSKELLAC